MPSYEKMFKGQVYIVLYVNYNLMISNPIATAEAVELLLKLRLELNILNGLQGHLSCEVRFSEDMRDTQIGSFKTPGTPNFLITRAVDDKEKVSIKGISYFSPV